MIVRCGLLCQVLLVLTLFCQASLEKQLRLCFELFDIDGNGAMDKVL